MKIFKLVVFFLLIHSVSFAGTAYYVDPGAAGGGNGSFAAPWNSIALINAKSFSTGDDVYFKVGTTISLPAGQFLNIRHDGTSGDPAIIGAYYGQNQFGLNGNARPIISGLVGSTRTGGTLHVGAIRYRKTSAVGYVHVKDLHVTGVIGYGVEMNGAFGIAGDGQSIEYCKVENVKTTNTASMGIGLYLAHNSDIEDCIVEDPNQDLVNYASGCGIDVGALQQEGRTKYNTVKGCIVARGYEGIGVYNGSLYTTIEDNIVYNCRTYHIYVDNSRYGTIRNNLVYSTPNARGGANNGGGITFDSEAHHGTFRVAGDWDTYGNYIAGLHTGITLLCNSYAAGTIQKNHDIYNNIIVDSLYNFRFNHDQYGGWTNNLIHDNYSFIFTSGMTHVSKDSPLGVTWTDNFFNSHVGGNAGASQVEDNYSLSKETGWRTLTSGAVSVSDFAFDEGSPGGAIKIMPLGDSITVNDAEGYKSYRYYLYQSLVDDGVNVDFVGSTTTQEFEGFDPDHEGHSGYRADQIADTLPYWLSLNMPDIVLLHIGHNDISQGQTIASTVDDIEEIIDILQADNPAVAIFLAKIIYGGGGPGLHEDLNDELPAVAVAKTTETSEVIIVDMNILFDYTIHIRDGAHPNDAGDQAIAQSWFEEMVKYLNATPPPGEAAEIAKTDWELVYVSSQETVGESGGATNFFDGDTGTRWHTKYTVDVLPHEIQIDLGEKYVINKFTYLPRVDVSQNGTIHDYEFYVSDSTESWGTAVATGEWANNKDEKVVTFTAKAGRYVRLRALSSVTTDPRWASGAEIDVWGYEFVPALPVTTFYVDCSAVSDGDGSFASPWNNTSSVNDAVFMMGSDIYFKAGVTCTLTEDDDRLIIDWSGTFQDDVIVGSYYGENLFGIGEDGRPVIDGDNLYPTTDQAVIQVAAQNYIKIKDLKIQNAGAEGERAAGIIAIGATNIDAENCHIYRVAGQGILYGRVIGGNVYDNVISENGYPNFPEAGAAIEISAVDLENSTSGIMVKQNTIHGGGWYGIGFHKKVKDSFAESNIIYDMGGNLINIDAGTNISVYYNLLYTSTDGDRTPAIMVDNLDGHIYLYSGQNKIYGNFISGTSRGISLACDGRLNVIPAGHCHSGTKLYNNTIVDAGSSFYFEDQSEDDSIEIKNNISLHTINDLLHYNDASPDGVSFSHNLYYGGHAVIGAAATNYVTGDPLLSKSSGWRSVAAGSLTIDDFKLMPGSPAIDTGIEVE